MELNSDLVAVQSILSHLVKRTGDFRKIQHKGGNEEKILELVGELQKFLNAKQYLLKSTINASFHSELEHIVTFLLINTEYKNALTATNDFLHLMNIVPQLSKCLLVHTLLQLNLAEILYKCLTLPCFPIEVVVELFNEALKGLRYLKPKQRLECSMFLIATAEKKISATETSNKNEERVDDLVSVTEEILAGLMCVHDGDNLTRPKVHQLIGHTFLRLLELLLICDKNNAYVSKLVKSLIHTSCSIVQLITLDMYIAWADIKHSDNEPLQLVVSEKAYLIIEKYSKMKEAQDLTSMLGPMARKPLTLKDKMRNASQETMMEQINKNDATQREWFKRFMSTNVLETEESLKFLERWSHLCTPDDVLTILNQRGDERSMSVVIKCASNLTQKQLLKEMWQHYAVYGFEHTLNPNIQAQFILLLNKLNDSNTQRNVFDFEVLLLCLENFKQVLYALYNECVKNAIFLQYFTDTFDNLQEILGIERVGFKVLKEFVEINTPNAQIALNYVQLLNELLKRQVVSNEELLTGIIKPTIEASYNGDQKQYLELFYTLQILNKSHIQVDDNVLKLLFRIMNECRCKFFDFNQLKMNIVKECVEIVRKIETKESNQYVANEDDDKFVKYYKKSLLKPTGMLRVVCEHFDIEKYAESVCKMLQVLPLCITEEWLNLALEIQELSDLDKTLQLYRDILILICELVISQEKSNNSDIESIYTSLKNCLRQFGIVAQHFADRKEDEIMCAKHVCRLISKIPSAIKEEIGVSLINLISDECLQSLADNKEFVCLVVSINNLTLCKILSKRMLGQ